MRRIYYLFIAGTLLFGMISCNENKEKENATTPTESVESTETTTSSNSEEKVALNPPHGQPGHRCEIPVGQPLTGGTNTSNSATPQNVQLTTPLMQENNQGGENLNPPHGQPGHRCEVPVGQPLP